MRGMPHLWTVSFVSVSFMDSWASVLLLDSVLGQCMIIGQLRVCLIIGHALQDSVSKVDSEWGVVAVSHYWTGIAGQCLRTGHDPTLCPKNGQCPKMGQGGGGSEINSRFKIKSRINELTKIR